MITQISHLFNKGVENACVFVRITVLLTIKNKILLKVFYTTNVLCLITASLSFTFLTLICVPMPIVQFYTEEQKLFNFLNCVLHIMLCIPSIIKKLMTNMHYFDICKKYRIYLKIKQIRA